VKETRTISYERVVRTKFDHVAARRLRDQGKTLTEIKAALGTDAHLATISRAISRARQEAVDASQT
jgi:hypothetical protein